MTHGNIRYSDFAVINAILVCLNLSENYHTGIYYYFTCFIHADISQHSELFLAQIICRATEGFFVFCLVLVLLWSHEACRRNKLKYEGKISRTQKPYCCNWTCPTCVVYHFFADFQPSTKVHHKHLNENHKAQGRAADTLKLYLYTLKSFSVSTADNFCTSWTLWMMISPLWAMSIHTDHEGESGMAQKNQTICGPYTKWWAECLEAMSLLCCAVLLGAAL